MISTSRVAFVFSLVFTLFMVLPAFLGQPASGFALMTRGDWLDLFTPLALLPFFYLLYTRADRLRPTRRENLLFLVIAAVWAEGHGIHLAANSIGHHLVGIDSDPARLAHMYDEVLSHYLWHSATVVMSLVILLRQWQSRPPTEMTQWPWAVAGGLIYGFTFFAITVEGTTGPVGIPLAALTTLAIVLRGRRYLSTQPLLAFFGIGYAVSLLFFAGWALYWGGLPEFSEIGIL